MRRTTIIAMAVVLGLFILSWILRSASYVTVQEHYLIGGLKVTFSAFLTLAILSFLYKDNPFYKFLGIMLLMRLSRNRGWLARWPLAFIVGTTAGLNFVRYLRSDFMEQVSATFVPLFVDWKGVGYFISHFSLSASGQFVAIVANWVIFLGVICGIIYFFFSKEHKGVFGAASRVGIWVLMITFGASFGYTVMGRISLLVGRITFLFRDWLGWIS